MFTKASIDFSYCYKLLTSIRYTFLFSLWFGKQCWFNKLTQNIKNRDLFGSFLLFISSELSACTAFRTFRQTVCSGKSRQTNQTFIFWLQVIRQTFNRIFDLLRRSARSKQVCTLRFPRTSFIKELLLNKSYLKLNFLSVVCNGLTKRSVGD